MLMLPYFFSSTSYFLQSSFDLYWTAHLIDPASAMPQWFIHIYALVPGLEPNGEEPPIPVLYFGLDYWSQLYAFSLTDKFICSEPCKTLAYSNL